MPFPPIRFCLVCEVVRVEERGKVSLLGFYGVAPEVTIGLPHFQAPLAQLGFLLSCTPAQGTFNLSTRLTDDAGAVILETSPASVSLNPPPGILYMNLNLQMAGVHFPHAGTYRLALIVDGEEHFQTTFRVRQEAPTVPPAATAAPQPQC